MSNNFETPPPPPPTMQPGPPPPPAKSSNGLATAGFVLGLLGFLGSWIPILNILGIILGILGVIFAGIGLSKSKRTHSGKGLSIAGLVLGALAVIIAVVVNAAFVDAVDEAVNETKTTSTSTVAVGAPAPSAGAAQSGEEGKPSFVNGVLTTDELKIVITDHKVIAAGQKGNKYGDKPVIAFWYKTTNLSDKEVDPSDWIFLMEAYQDNNPNAENKLEMGMLPDDRFRDSQMENIKKGGTVESAVAYELDDETTPVELVASELFGDEIGRVTYNLK